MSEPNNGEPVNVDKPAVTPEQLREAIAELSSNVAAMTGELRTVRVRQRRHGRTLALAVVGLVFDLALSGLFVYQHFQQECVNGLSSQYFAAERGKVNGQIRGETQQLKGVNEIHSGAASVGVVVFADGTAHWIKASRRFLHKIDAIQKQHNC